MITIANLMLMIEDDAYSNVYDKVNAIRPADPFPIS